MNMHNNDYIQILKYYNLPIPKSRQLLKEEGEKILALKLCKSLVGLIPKQAVFATTRSDNEGMKAILQELDFNQEGIAYENRSKTNMLQFYFRDPQKFVLDDLY